MNKSRLVVIDDLAPEDSAMLQALYSRSPKSVVEHLEKVKQVGSGKFMDVYYVGYGHASIGDCGTTSVFIENVSMLAAKAIQDWPLYSGQEASTRYMDFSTATFENPDGSEAGHAIQERWRAFYMRAYPIVRASVVEQRPRPDTDDAKELAKYENAVNARTFDICRGFIPAGAHTNLSWTTNLRQAGDKLHWLSGHPDVRIASLGLDIEAALAARYKHSFRSDSYEAISYRCAAMLADYFLAPEEAVDRLTIRPNIDMARLAQLSSLMRNRPRGVELPHWTAEVGTIRSEFMLDFGSFRDLQRHRAGTCRMPMLTTTLGFHPFYLDAIPGTLRDEAAALIKEQADAIGALKCTPVRAQGYIAMGFQVPCRVTQPFNAYVYRLELRSAKTIHPTLRAVVHDEIRWFRETFPHVALHVDMDPDSWTLRRGSQTIEAR